MKEEMERRDFVGKRAQVKKGRRKGKEGDGAFTRGSDSAPFSGKLEMQHLDWSAFCSLEHHGCRVRTNTTNTDDVRLLLR